MRHKYLFVIIVFTVIISLSTINVNAQQWGDYTLYSVQNSNTAYLMDTNGTNYHTWTFATTAKTAYSTYMLPGGTLVRTVMATTNPMGNAGGMTGRVQKVDYNGNVTWDFTYSTSTYCLHHDICPLPNGNVLMISYDVRTSAEVTAAGCSTTLPNGIWSEKIIEVQPTGATTGTIVWEWHLWDHLCQNYSSAKANYVTSIVQNPQLMNINYTTTQDWFHMNGIDYNPTLDQIVFSSHNLNSLFIIDHSTTTAQAATHTGGNAGKGGDFLYRWGNPTSYGATGTTDFNVVHDAHWIQTGCPRAGQLAAFNNKGGTGSKSCIDVIQPPLVDYNYSLTLGSAYTPSTYAWRHTYSGNATQDMGNSQHLPNGNVLVCMAMSGTIYEIDSNQTLLWTKTITGTSPHAYRYSAAYTTSAAMSVSAAADQDTVCSGTTIQLSSTATGSALQYSWVSFPSGFTSNLQNPSVAPTKSTKYVVTVYNGVLSTSDSVYIFVNPVPDTAGIISGTSVICQGLGSYTYIVPSIPNATSYVWTLPSGASGSSTTDSIVVSYGTSAVAGNITVSGVNACGNGVAASLAISQSNIIPANAGIISGETVVCQGQNNVTYTVPNISNATSYIWTLPGGATGTSNSNNISISYGSSAASGNLSVHGSNACGIGDSSILSITVNTAPATPSITLMGNTLTSNSTTGNQWYNLASGAITSATAQTYTPQQIGDYFVIVTANGCGSDSSNIIHFDNTGITTVYSDEINIKIHPNPFKNNTTFYYSLNKTTDVRLSIFDLTGRELKVVCDNKQEKGDHKLVIDAENLTAGVYFYKINIGNKSKSGKLIIAK